MYQSCLWVCATIQSYPLSHLTVPFPFKMVVLNSSRCTYWPWNEEQSVWRLGRKNSGKIAASIRSVTRTALKVNVGFWNRSQYPCEFWPHQLSWLRSVWLPSVLPGQCQDNSCDWANISTFHIAITVPTSTTYILVTASGVKWTING